MNMALNLETVSSLRWVGFINRKRYIVYIYIYFFFLLFVNSVTCNEHLICTSLGCWEYCYEQDKLSLLLWNLWFARGDKHKTTIYTINVIYTVVMSAKTNGKSFENPYSVV